MRYLQRDKNGKVLGHYANEQTYAKELVADDHLDLLVWNEAKKPKSLIGKTMEERIIDLEIIIANLKG